MYQRPEWWFSSPLIVGFGLVVILLAIWSIYWKGRGLWKAARLGHLGWFIALLLINTAGILDILYIYVFSKPKAPSVQKPADLPPHDHDHTPAIATPHEVAKHSDQTG